MSQVLTYQPDALASSMIYSNADQEEPLRILMLEDRAMDAELIAAEFFNFEIAYESKVVPNKEQYLAALDSYQPHIVLSDYTLPQYTGLEALQDLKKITPFVPFIISTGSLNEEIAVACIKAGADDYVLKDSMGRLVSAMMSALDNKRILVEREKSAIEREKLNEQLHNLSQHLENIRDEEKKKIAMEIHDQLGQELTGNKLGLFWIQQHLKAKGFENADQQAVHDKINYLVDLTTQTIQTVRRIAHELRPVVLDDIGLIPALEWHVENYNKNHETQVHLDIESDLKDFDKELATAIYRITQEALTNVNRHAQANNVWINFDCKDKHIQLTISDDGVGIDLEKAAKSKSLGLFGIKERIKTWNGDIDITGLPGEGTTIDITLTFT